MIPEIDDPKVVDPPKHLRDIRDDPRSSKMIISCTIKLALLAIVRALTCDDHYTMYSIQVIYIALSQKQAYVSHSSSPS